MKLLAGNSNLPLARSISDYLEMPLTQASVRRFADEGVFDPESERVWLQLSFGAGGWPPTPRMLRSAAADPGLMSAISRKVVSLNRI